MRTDSSILRAAYAGIDPGLRERVTVRVLRQEWGDTGGLDTLRDQRYRVDAVVLPEPSDVRQRPEGVREDRRASVIIDTQAVRITSEDVTWGKVTVVGDDGVKLTVVGLRDWGPFTRLILTKPNE